MPTSNKVGTQLLVSPHMRDRARALAIVRRESVAEVYRVVLERYLAFLEGEHADDLHELHEALDKLGGDRSHALDEMVKKRMDFVRLAGAMNYPEPGDWPDWFRDLVHAVAAG